MMVQISNRRKVRVKIQRNTDGDTPSICVAAQSDLRMCGGMLFYMIYWAPAQFIKMIHGIYDLVVDWAVKPQHKQTNMAFTTI